MGGRREANKKAKTHWLTMLAAEEKLRLATAVRSQRRERRRQIRREDASLADALNAVSVGTEARNNAPTVGAPLRLTKDVDMKSVKVARPRIRKRCKKCQQRLNKIRARMAKRISTKMNIDFETKRHSELNAAAATSAPEVKTTINTAAAATAAMPM